MSVEEARKYLEDRQGLVCEAVNIPNFGSLLSWWRETGLAEERVANEPYFFVLATKGQKRGGKYAYYGSEEYLQTQDGFDDLELHVSEERPNVAAGQKKAKAAKDPVHAVETAYWNALRTGSHLTIQLNFTDDRNGFDDLVRVLNVAVMGNGTKKIAAWKFSEPYNIQDIFGRLGKMLEGVD